MDEVFVGWHWKIDNREKPTLRSRVSERLAYVKKSQSLETRTSKVTVLDCLSIVHRDGRDVFVGGHWKTDNRRETHASFASLGETRLREKPQCSYGSTSNVART